MNIQQRLQIIINDLNRSVINDTSKSTIFIVKEKVERLMFDLKPLTDDEIFQICRNEASKLPNKNIDIDFARCIEKAHGI